MKKILLVTDDAYTYSGREKICDYMSSIFSENYYIEVLSMSGKGAPFYQFSKVSKINTLEGVKGKYFFLRGLESKFDYVFVLSMGKLSVFYQIFNLFTARNTKGKSYACEHVSLSSLNFLIRFLKFIFLRFYTNVVTLTKVDLDRLNSWGISGKVIENPIFIKDNKIKERTLKAIAVGRLDKQKNFMELVSIWKDFIQEKKENYTLLIAGEGEDRDLLEDFIVESGLSDSIILLGKVSNIEYYYKSVDICLMTSLYEGLPLALLEAKSYGLPCIAYDCLTGPKEIIENDVDGYIIPMHNKVLFVECLERIYSSDEEYYRLVAGTKKVSEKFSHENIRKKWLSLVK